MTQDIFPAEADGDELLESQRYVDIMIVVDKSGSMKDDIEALKDNLNYFIDQMKRLVAGESEYNQVDIHVGALCYDTSWQWDWVDLTDDIERVRQKLGNVEIGGDECTPHAMDYAVEHAGWRDKSKKFMAVFTDEPAEGGEHIARDEFKTLLDKITSHGIVLYFIGDERTFSGHIYKLLNDYPSVFVNNNLQTDRGEKLLKWLAVSMSSTRRPQESAYGGPKDIFGCFHRVKTV